MAGTVIGSIEHKSTTNSPPESHQQLFKSIYDFFSASTYATIISLNYGAGTGTDYYDGANPFGEGAFFVARMNGTGSGNASASRSWDYYVLVQYYDASAWSGTSPLGPGSLDGSTTADGVGIAVVMRTDGGNPWGGTTNVNGSDAKTNPVWVGGSALQYLSSNVTTAYADLMRLGQDMASTFPRWNILGDADSFVMLSEQNEGNAWYLNYHGIYTPVSGLTVTYPLCSLYIAWTNQQGTARILTPRYSEEGGPVTGTVHSQSDILQNTNYVLDNLSSPVAIDFPVTLTAEGLYKGCAGFLDTALVSNVYNVSDSDSTTALTRAYWGPVTQNTLKMSVPWDGATTPRTGTTRAGVQF